MNSNVVLFKRWQWLLNQNQNKKVILLQNHQTSRQMDLRNSISTPVHLLDKSCSVLLVMEPFPFKRSLAAPAA